MKRVMVCLKKIVCVMLWAVFLSAEAQAGEVQEFTPGFNIYAYHLEEGKAVSDFPLPAAELGYFTADKSNFHYGEIAERLGIPLETIQLIRCMGYIYTDKPTKVVFVVRSDGITGNAVFVDKKLKLKKFGRFVADSAVVILDKPGLHEVDMRIYGGINNKRQISSVLNLVWDFDFKIKTENSNKPDPAHTVLVLPIKAQ